MDNSPRVERMLRELHSGPPLHFLEDAFSLQKFASGKMAAVREAARDVASGQDDEQALV